MRIKLARLLSIAILSRWKLGANAQFQVFDDHRQMKVAGQRCSANDA